MVNSASRLNGTNAFYDFVLFQNKESVSPNAKQNQQIASFLSKNAAFICNDKIKIKNGRLKVFVDGKWQLVDLTSNQEKDLKKIAKTDQKIVLTKDPLADFVKQTAAELKTPTYYLYSSGGGGHRTAKEARMETDWTQVYEAVKNNPNCPGVDTLPATPADFIAYCKERGLVNENDVLHDFLGGIGKKASKTWDEAQQSGDVEKQERLLSMQWVSDIVFAIPVFVATLRNLIKHQPETIVSTQAMATPAIMMAIQIYNAFYKPEGANDTVLHLYMTDMPTTLSGHFFNSLKKLTHLGGKDKIVLYAPKPKNDIDWSIMCGLPNQQVVELETHELPVRPAFLRAAQNYQRNPNSFQIKLCDEREVENLKDVLAFQGINAEVPSIQGKKPAFFDLNIDKSGSNTLLMLGSKPTPEAVTEYINRYVEIAKENPDQKINCFAFCGPYMWAPLPGYSDKEWSFYDSVCDQIRATADWPKNLTVVPLTYQDADQLVPLMVECDTITRSGGSSSFELFLVEAVSNKFQLPERQRYIHAQRVKGRENLVDSIPGHERGNFFFVRDSIGEDTVSVMEPKLLHLDAGRIVHKTMRVAQAAKLQNPSKPELPSKKPVIENDFLRALNVRLASASAA